MEAALIILAALVIVGSLLYIQHRLGPSDTANPGDSAGPQPEKGAVNAEDGCCGMHITCERDSLLASVSAEIEYFDDEELDRFSGRTSEGYSASEADEFREVMLTMPVDNIAAWARSLQLRNIELPDAVRDELLLIVSEERASRASSDTATSQSGNGTRDE